MHLIIWNIDDIFIRLAAHIVMAYVFTFWTCYVLYKEYKIVTDMRLHFLASQSRRPDQFTVSFKYWYLLLEKKKPRVLIIIFLCRFLWEMSPQILMNLSVNMLNISFVLITLINILYIRFVFFLSDALFWWINLQLADEVE